MKAILSYIGFAILTFSQHQDFSFGKNNQKRNGEGFHGIQVAMGIEVSILKDAKENVIVQAEDAAYLNNVITEVRHGILKIYRNDSWKFWDVRRNTKVKVLVSYKTLDSVEAVSGGLIKGDLSTDILEVNLASGGYIELKGGSKKLNVDASSGGDFRGYEFATEYLEADVSTGAGLNVTVNKEVSAQVSTGGFVWFKGLAKVKYHSSHTGGEIKHF